MYNATFSTFSLLNAAITLGLFFIPSKHMFISLQLIAPCVPVQRVQE